ncbi:GMC oxidoreductase [Artomyces pyxidatus]|uniref:GMC oxidoreductase n=1 Tax=Artomyces pyxidatus TaxID=48021 RepID=A0ACB8TB82_9AGAM|nr:GMC oxidoreductase [Artomyces pyxidatus]
MGSSHSAYLLDPAQFATQHPGKDGQDTWREYDYIIAGGGTAGCVLASRLSEDPNVTVLLVEAGGPHEKELLVRLPMGWPKSLKTPIDWAFQSIPQARGGQRKFAVPRGKVLGGTSSINAMIYNRCSPEDFDEWVRLGATGWGYDDLWPYFQKSESFTPNPKYPGIKPENHGTDGPWKTGLPDEVSPMQQALVEACQELGVEAIGDFNSPKGNLGASIFTTTQDRKGQRSSVAVSYLTPVVLARPNLTVGLHTIIEKILIDESTSDEPRAIGLQLSKSATSPKYRVRATKEVIVCGGTVGTPHLLLLSGLGPKEELEKVGVKVVKDLSQVGKKYYDHVAGGPVTIRAKPGWTYDYLSNPLSGLLALIKWQFTGKGPMTAMAAPGCAFIRSDDPRIRYDTKLGEEWPIKDFSAGPNGPDIEILWFPLITGDLNVEPPRGIHGVTIGAMAIKPSSSGTVTLQTASIYDKPLIDPNVFESENDWRVVVRGMRFILRLARTERLKGILEPKPHSTDQKDIFWPGDADPDQITDKEISDYVRDNALPIFHPTSSARIGQTAETGVVDVSLKVHGVKGLRVCDASVFPSQVSGHPAAVVVAVAEKAADIIKAEHAT